LLRFIVDRIAPGSIGKNFPASPRLVAIGYCIVTRVHTYETVHTHEVYLAEMFAKSRRRRSRHTRRLRAGVRDAPADAWAAEHGPTE
jgi:hypothetical protein